MSCRVVSCHSPPDTNEHGAKGKHFRPVVDAQAEQEFACLAFTWPHGTGTALVGRPAPIWTSHVRPAFRFLVFDVPPRDLNLTMIRTCTDPSYRSCWIHPSQPRPIPRQMCVTGCHIIRDRELVQRDDAVLVCCNTYGTHARLSPNIVPVRGLCMHIYMLVVVVDYLNLRHTCHSANVLFTVTKCM